MRIAYFSCFSRATISRPWELDQPQFQHNRWGKIALPQRLQ
jgi:hypothetical protein